MGPPIMIIRAANRMIPARSSWTSDLTRVSIFIPTTSSPMRISDCTKDGPLRKTHQRLARPDTRQSTTSLFVRHHRRAKLQRSDASAPCTRPTVPSPVAIQDSTAVIHPSQLEVVSTPVDSEQYIVFPPSMPTYLLHGFRWPRPLVRIHVILQNLDDVASEWLVAPDSTTALLTNLHELYPQVMQHLHQLRFIEQYDPADESAGSGSQPYAYVADIVHEIKLGVAVDDVVSAGIGNEQWNSMMELRDKLAPEEKVSWYIVVCGDEERWVPRGDDMLQTDTHPGGERASESDSYAHSGDAEHVLEEASEVKGFRKFFGSGRLGRKKTSNKSSAESSAEYNSISPYWNESKEALSSSRSISPTDIHIGRRASVGGLYSNLSFEQIATRWNPNGIEPMLDSKRSSRRNSTINGIALSSRGVSPDAVRSYSPVSILRGHTATDQASGNHSPVSAVNNIWKSNDWKSTVGTLRGRNSFRSSSPLRNAYTNKDTNNARTVSPARSSLGGPTPQQQQQQQQQQQHQIALAALQGSDSSHVQQEHPKFSDPLPKQRQRLSLMTQLPVSGPAPVPEEEEDGVEVVQEIIAMSPAVRTNNGFARYRHSARSSQIFSPATARSSQVSLAMSQSDKDLPVFGQNINPNDLIATGMENAFTNLGA
nr:hypothetical protein CFP56_19644 [Quercus suber]